MLNRRELLQRAAAAAPAVMLSKVALASAADGPSFGGRNVVIFMTDQQRALQHFPRGWAERNLPGYSRLARNGVTFDNATCNACMCSPSRATFFTGQLPAHHGVKYTLEEGMPNDQYPQVPLSPDIPNLATTMAAAGYDVYLKGKWHLCKPLGETWSPADLEQYGFKGWDPPDAGADQSIPQAGGGSTDNDGRFMHGPDGVIPFLQSRQPGDRPFCLVVSLVNPHDVLMYPRNYENAGYDDSWLDGEDIDLPATVNEDLKTKPRVQQMFKRYFNLSGVLGTPARKKNYLKFYGNLMRASDAYLVEILNTLAQKGLTDDTLVVATSDHGEMGMAHGSMRQKNFQGYEETLRVPLVWSNPKLFPRPRRSNALVSHVDFLPTLAGLVGAPKQDGWQGKDYSGLVTGTSKRPVQDHTIFTFEDVQAGQPQGPYLPAPNCILAIREKRFKLVETFDAKGQKPSEWEFYDRKHDPIERRNLAWKGVKRTHEQELAFKRLHRILELEKKTRLQPLPTTPQPQVLPSN
jgi:arylsulfatase A-like enzyme